MVQRTVYPEGSLVFVDFNAYFKYQTMQGSISLEALFSASIVNNKELMHKMLSYPCVVEGITQRYSDPVYRIKLPDTFLVDEYAFNTIGIVDLGFVFPWSKRPKLLYKDFNWET